MYQFEKLDVWKLSVELVKSVYKLTKSFPSEERYGFTSQTQRAATSISLNIAEGRGASTDKEFVRFLYIALRSLYEVMACLRLAAELGFVDGKSEALQEACDLTNRLGAQLRALINRIEKDEKAKSE